MEGIPPIVFILPPLAIGLLIFTIVMRRRGMAATQHATVGALAQRLGLYLAEGDPTLNLHYLSQPAFDYKRAILMQGMPYGRQVTWEFSEGLRTQDYVFLVRRTFSWGCWLVAKLGVSIPAFEVVPRQPTPYLEPQTQLEDVPEVLTGHPAVDATYSIRTTDPRVAAALGHVLGVYHGKHYVHLFGEGNAVTMPITRYALPYFVHDAEAYLHALECVACALEGRPPPA